ncbi:MAG: hypothetical protein QXK95_03650 [Nitrososphaerota archaeon]|nr:hypothetical protein [Candidatus Geocrenenecus dongiae]
MEMIEEYKILGWADVKNIVEKEAEKRIGGRIKKSWVDSIWLTPYIDGGKWIARLRIQVKKNIFKTKLYEVSAKINPLSENIEEIEINEVR